jgi:hypothetical protein
VENCVCHNLRDIHESHDAAKCNAPAMFQRLMTVMFQDFIGRFVHIHLDNTFAFINSIEEHEEHLGITFDKLCKVQVYLKESKFDLYSK